MRLVVVPGMVFGFGRSSSMVTRDEALPGRAEPLPGIPERHVVLDTPLQGPWPQGTQVFYIGMGCFWGTERIFWKQPGVVTTAAGYVGGFTPNPTYEEVCTGRTGHTEGVLVAYDPGKTSPELLFKQFWENHDSTTRNRQGNDMGTQYRSAIYWTTPEQEQAAVATRDTFQNVLSDNGLGQISTEIRSAAEAGPFYYAESYHQQYLHKNPGDYCKPWPQRDDLPGRHRPPGPVAEPAGGRASCRVTSERTSRPSVERRDARVDVDHRRAIGDPA